jgi:hypothetical protein
VVLARGEPGERLDDATGDRGRQHGLALVDDVDRRYELLRRGVLEQEAARAGAQPVVDVLVEIEGREDEDARGGFHRREAPGRLEPVDVGHPDVHQRDVGCKAPDGGDGLLAVGSFAEDLDVRLLLEGLGRSAPAEIRDDVQKLLAGMRQRAGLEVPDEVTEAEVSAAEERAGVRGTRLRIGAGRGRRPPSRADTRSATQLRGAERGPELHR